MIRPSESIRLGDPTRRRTWNVLTALLGTLLLSLPATGSASEIKSSTDGRQSNLKTVTLPIEGICSMGLADIRAGLKNVSGVSKVEGSEKVEGIQITFAPQHISAARITKMVKDLGYRIGPAKTP